MEVLPPFPSFFASSAFGHTVVRCMCVCATAIFVVFFSLTACSCGFFKSSHSHQHPLPSGAHHVQVQQSMLSLFLSLPLSLSLSLSLSLPPSLPFLFLCECIWLSLCWSSRVLILTNVGTLSHTFADLQDPIDFCKCDVVTFGGLGAKVQCIKQNCNKVTEKPRLPERGRLRGPDPFIGFVNNQPLQDVWYRMIQEIAHGWKIAAGVCVHERERKMCVEICDGVVSFGGVHFQLVRMCQ